MESFYLTRYPNDKNAKPLMRPRKNISWESKAVFNPSVIKTEDKFVMLYRTYPSKLKGTTLRFNRPARNFENQISYIGYAESNDGKDFKRRYKPFLSPDSDFDRFGCEDPRITKIGDTFYITYTAIGAPIEDGKESSLRIALATTSDFISVKKHGIIGPARDSKAAAIFPEPVNGGKIGLVLTVFPDSGDSHVAVRYYNSVEELLNSSDESWENFLRKSGKTTLLETRWWLHRGPELGAPPIKTDEGWLFIYSTESMSDSWTISAALADLEKPHKIIARVPGYILQPARNYELKGLVPNVTFPSGAVIVKDNLFVYYGAADTVVGLATCKLEELLDYLRRYKEVTKKFP